MVEILNPINRNDSRRRASGLMFEAILLKWRAKLRDMVSQIQNVGITSSFVGHSGRMTLPN
jgi:uncharacterized protein (UPF0128 family)